MKKLVFLFLSFKLFASSEIDLMSNKIQEDIDKGTQCVPSLHNEMVSFCTGETLSMKEIKSIVTKTDRYCEMNIEKKGYRVFTEAMHDKVDKEIWDSFYYSTKWAETIHDKKMVFFKNIAGRIDCLHEFIHVLQWTSHNAKNLAPLKRIYLQKKFESALIKEADNLKSQTDRQKLQEKQTYLQEKINLLKAFAQISSWLDEKDVYYLFFKICSHDVKCSANDLDTVIANLFKLKEHFPWRVANEISHVGLESLRKKEVEAISRHRFANLDEKDQLEIDNLFKKSIPEIIGYIKNKNIFIYQFLVNDKNLPSNAIPLELIQALPIPDKEILKKLLSYSKINSGYVLGKFLCTDKENFIILTNKSTKEVLIHEYMHYLQSQKNAEVCQALTKQNELNENFKKGLIKREEFEERILSSKVTLWKMEEEVYHSLLKRKAETSNEELNNKAQAISYLIRLNANPSEIKNKLERPQILNFEEVDGLPMVKYFGENLILDLGAMDSVIDPKVFFDQFSFDTIRPLKFKNMANSRGEVVEAPYVSVDFQKENWVLLNLNLPMAKGVLGLDYFEDRDFVIYPQDKKIEFVSKITFNKDAFWLQGDYDQKYHAIEFSCSSSGPIFRLDSGSQVYGDQVSGPSLEKIKCGSLKFRQKLNQDLQNKTIFSHGVSANLGWPFIKQFKKVSISLREGKISFL